MTKRIVIIDDHFLFREGVKRILDFEDCFEVVAEGDDGDQALALVEQYQPDVVLMDINMPKVDGVQATKRIFAKYPDVRVIILSIHDDENYVTHALKSGANGYLLKEMDSEALIEAIKIVSEGGSYLHPKVTHNLVKEFQRLSKVQSGSIEDIEYRPLHLPTHRNVKFSTIIDGK